MILYRKSLLAGALALAAPLVQAQQQTQTVTGNFTVSANVQNVCIFLSGGTPTDLNFGTYNPSSESTAQGSARVQCSNGLGLRAFIDTNGGQRAMTRSVDGVTSTLPYEVYRDSGFQDPFPDSSPSSSNFISNGLPLTINYYGRILAGQVVSPGIYTQQATLHIDF